MSGDHDAPYIPPANLMGKALRWKARATGRRLKRVRPSRGIVSFSFDDFPKSAVTVGAAEMERAGARATYYASTGFAGQDTHHGAMFDGGDLARLVAAGHEIGAHTHGHIDCARASEDRILADDERNRAALRKMGFETPIRSFAFPFGEAGPRVKRALAERYDTLRGVRPGCMRGRADFNMLPAVALDHGEAGLARALEALQRAAAEAAWVILFTHDVQDDPTSWGCTPDMLRKAVETAHDLDLDILPVSEAADVIAAAA